MNLVSIVIAHVLSEFILAERLSAQEAERLGLVSKIFPADQLVDEAVKLGEKIASMSQVAAAMVKETVNAANNLPLDEGKLTKPSVELL